MKESERLALEAIRAGQRAEKAKDSWTRYVEKSNARDARFKAQKALDKEKRQGK